MRMGWRLTILGFISTVAAAAGLGIASGESEPASDMPGAACIPGISADEGIILCEHAPSQMADGPPLEITRCVDVPPLPPDEDVSPGWSTSGTDVLASLLLNAPEGDAGEYFEFIIRVDDPTCKQRPDIWKYLDVNPEPPRFEDARIVVRPGEDRAYVGYTLIDRVGQLFAPQDGITARHADGRPVEWRHQTATGGPSEIGTHGKRVVEPATDATPYTDVGDADYFDVGDITIGETIMVTFRFFHVRDCFDASPSPPRALV